MTDLENALETPAPRQQLLGYCLAFEMFCFSISSRIAIVISLFFQHSLLFCSIN